MTGKEAYKLYLQSPHWRKLRREAMEKWGDRCVVCDVPKVQIHHLDYRHGQWCMCTAEDVIPLCKYHHKTVHFDAVLQAEIKAKSTIEEKRIVISRYLKLRDQEKKMVVFKRQRLVGDKIVFSNKSRGYTQRKWLSYENKVDQIYLQDRPSPPKPGGIPKQEVQDFFKF